MFYRNYIESLKNITPVLYYIKTEKKRRQCIQHSTTAPYHNRPQTNISSLISSATSSAASFESTISIALSSSTTLWSSSSVVKSPNWTGTLVFVEGGSDAAVEVGAFCPILAGGGGGAEGGGGDSSGRRRHILDRGRGASDGIHGSGRRASTEQNGGEGT